jgi:probable rRNA maturation factor
MSKTQNRVQFHFLLPFSLRNRQALKIFINRIFQKELLTVESLEIIFCNDARLLSLNKQYLNHDFYTDILSFPLSEAGKPLIGEIYISVDRVRENAKSLHATFKEEMHRVIFHGVLHFCGYKDKSASQIKEIRAKESEYMDVYFKRHTPIKPKPA